MNDDDSVSDGDVFVVTDAPAAHTAPSDRPGADAVARASNVSALRFSPRDVPEGVEVNMLARHLAVPDVQKLIERLSAEPGIMCVCVCVCVCEAEI